MAFPYQSNDSFAVMSVTPKYRELTKDELQGLEKEFVDFLIINGITADDWIRLKAGEPHKAEDILTLFSDVVFEGIMRKVKYLEKRTPHELMTFQCLKDRIVLVGMKAGQSVDLMNELFIKEAMKSPPQGVSVYTTEKPYSTERELELFGMIQSGCSISEGKLFKALSLAL